VYLRTHERMHTGMNEVKGHKRTHG